MEIYSVILTVKAERDLRNIPQHVVKKLIGWVDYVAHKGLREARKIPGYHDEPLKGKRAGQRSIRLTKAYRAIYEIGMDGTLEIVKVVEVNKHDY